MNLTDVTAQLLLDLAVASIETGLACGHAGELPGVSGHPVLHARRSSFVTLQVDRRLRGCCGTLAAQRSLAADVWHNAWAAAFEDPRFPPLDQGEWQSADIEISVLSALEPLMIASEEELIALVRPGVDGLLIEFGDARATFLPAVWQQVPEPGAFLTALKCKAGLARDFWSPRVRVHRYTVSSLGPRSIATARTPCH